MKKSNKKEISNINFTTKEITEKLIIVYGGIEGLNCCKGSQGLIL